MKRQGSYLEKLKFEEEARLLFSERRSKKTSFSLKSGVEKRLRSVAERMDVPMSSIVDRALELYMDALEKLP